MINKSKKATCIFALLLSVLLIFGHSERGMNLQKIIQNDRKYDSNVVPINWGKMNTKPLSGELAEGIIYILNNGNKYIVNDWWNKKKNFDSQETNEYLKLSGTGENDIRSVSEQARTLAASIKLNIYDESYTGVSTQIAKERALKLTKSLGKAHCSNTEGGWGNAWQSAFWAADVAHAGWLMWEDFEDKDKKLIQNLIEYEADRFINYNVPYYKDLTGKIIFKGDSKAEENSWNSNILSVACAMMPNHERYNAWMNKNIELIISSFAAPSDTKSKKIINGNKLSELLKGSNMDEEGTVVNHNIIHPDYQSTISQNFLDGIFFAFGGQKIPQAVLFNADRVYEGFVELDLSEINAKLKGEHIYKRNENGGATSTIVYPNGTDWGTDRQINYFLVDVLADTFKFDKKCSVKGKDFALARLPQMKAMQDRSNTGQYYINGDSDKYANREEWTSWHAIISYMTLWISKNNLINITNESMLK